MTWQAARYVTENSRAKGNVRFVLLRIAEHASSKVPPFESWPSIEILAKETGLSDRTVQRCVHALAGLGAESGWPAPLDPPEIEILKGGGRQHCNLYRVIIKGDNPTPFTDTERVTGRHPLRRERVTSTTRKGDILTVKGDENVPKGQVTGSQPKGTEREQQQRAAQRFDECVKVIARERSLLSWVTNPGGTETATLKKLRGTDEKPLQSWLADHPDMSDDDVAGSYLRSEIPGAEGYQVHSDPSTNGARPNPSDAQQQAERKRQAMTPLDRAEEAVRVAKLTGDPLSIEAAEIELEQLSPSVRALVAVAS